MWGTGENLNEEFSESAEGGGVVSSSSLLERIDGLAVVIVVVNDRDSGREAGDDFPEFTGRNELTDLIRFGRDAADEPWKMTRDCDESKSEDKLSKEERPLVRWFLRRLFIPVSISGAMSTNRVTSAAHSSKPSRKCDNTEDSSTFCLCWILFKNWTVISRISAFSNLGYLEG